MKICEYCGAGFNHDNKMFCNRKCQSEYMKLMECHGCTKKYHPDEEVRFGFCSQECHDEEYIFRFKSNILSSLGFRDFMNGHLDWDLLEISYKVLERPTGKIMEKTMNFKK